MWNLKPFINHPSNKLHKSSGYIEKSFTNIGETKIQLKRITKFKLHIFKASTG